MAEPGRFLHGSAMGHVVRMTMTGAVGITFVFLVDAAGLFWVSRLGDPRLVAAIGGIGAAVWGWIYVTGLSRSMLPALDLAPPRPYANADRFRRH